MKLEDYLIEKKLTIIEAADELGIRYHSLRNWLHRTRPRPKAMKLLEKWSNGAVTSKDFYDAKRYVK